MKWYWHVIFFIMTLINFVCFYGEFRITDKLINTYGTITCLWILLWNKCYEYDKLKSSALDVIDSIKEIKKWKK